MSLNAPINRSVQGAEIEGKQVTNGKHYATQRYLCQSLEKCREGPLRQQRNLDDDGSDEFSIVLKRGICLAKPLHKNGSERPRIKTKADGITNCAFRFR
jgi:hypothetical protein